jgi:type IV pilus assembly protein PilP
MKQTDHNQALFFNCLPIASLRVLAGVSIAIVVLSGCANDMDQLKQTVSQIKTNAGEKIEPLPPITPYESFKYDAGSERSPFTPSSSVKSGLANSNRPNASRTREFLEQFSLDTLQMVGTLQVQGKNYGLVQGKDGLVHRVQVGNYIGQSDGRISSISNTKIAIIELVPDGLGGYIERPAALTLKD